MDTPLTIDDAILSFPCSTCQAEPGDHCTIRGVTAKPVKDADPEDQQFYYHAKRTDAGCWMWNVTHSLMDDDEKQEMLTHGPRP